MDDLDLAILHELSENPQERFSKIATNVGVSSRTVQKRVQKMKEANVIICSSVILDLSKLGYEGQAVLRIINAPGYEKAVTVEALRKIPNIFLIAETIGDVDIMAIAAVKNYRSIINTINTIRQLPSVEKIDENFVPDTQFPATREFTAQFRTQTDTY